MDDEWRLAEDGDLAPVSIGQALAVILLSPIVLAWFADTVGIDLVGVLLRALGVAL